MCRPETCQQTWWSPSTWHGRGRRSGRARDEDGRRWLPARLQRPDGHRRLGDGGPLTIVGVRVTNADSDMGSVTPLLDPIEQRTGALPKVLLADANHAKHDCIRNAAQRGVEA